MSDLDKRHDQILAAMEAMHQLSMKQLESKRELRAAQKKDSAVFDEIQNAIRAVDEAKYNWFVERAKQDGVEIVDPFGGKAGG